MTTDVVVVGSGVSGLAFAWKAARAGRKVTVLEREARIGGCFHSYRRPDGYWFEMGAHTCYNSYGGFLDIAVATGADKKIRERGSRRPRS
jgi:oxygen-dependent protoporphyrinogen oxidase